MSSSCSSGTATTTRFAAARNRSRENPCRAPITLALTAVPSPTGNGLIAALRGPARYSAVVVVTPVAVRAATAPALAPTALRLRAVGIVRAVTHRAAAHFGVGFEELASAAGRYAGVREGVEGVG